MRPIGKAVLSCTTQGTFVRVARVHQTRPRVDTGTPREGSRPIEKLIGAACASYAEIRRGGPVMDQPRPFDVAEAYTPQ